MPSTKTSSHQHNIPNATSPIGGGLKGSNPTVPNLKKTPIPPSSLKPVSKKGGGTSEETEEGKAKAKLDTDQVDVSGQSKGMTRQEDKPVSGKNKQDKDLANSNKSKDLSKRPSNEDEPMLTRKELKIQQHRKKILLAGCEPSMSMNYDTLAMDDYPSNEEVARAKFERDFWYTVITISGIVFASGFSGLVPAWLAGSAFGIGGLSAAFYYSPLREKWMGTKAFSALITKRKAMEFKALTHIQFLEGGDGLAWRCAKMHKYNSNLARKLFEGLAYYSKEKNLHELIKRKKQIRLYLLFMMESQKAYKRLQKDYLEHHFKHFDQEGWDDNLTDEELADFEANEAEFEDDVDNKGKSERKTEQSSN